MAPAIRSSIDAALWFLRAAQSGKKSLSAQKLQRLLYLAQVHFSGVNAREMMPAKFLAGEMGPYEPSVYVVFEAGPPEITAISLDLETEAVLGEIWRLYGGKSADALAKIIASDGAYISARQQGVGTEIHLPAMMAAFHGANKPSSASVARSVPVHQTDTGKTAGSHGKSRAGRLSSETILNVVGEELVKPALILRGKTRQKGQTDGKRLIDEIAESLAIPPKISNQSAVQARAGTKEVVKWRPKRNITRH